MQRAANRGRSLSKLGIGGLVAGSIVGGAAAIAIGQEAQRQSLNDAHTDAREASNAIVENYESAIGRAMNETYSHDAVIGQSFNLEQQNDLFGNALNTLKKNGINSVDIKLDGIYISTSILAHEVPQPTDEYNVIKTDIDHDGTDDFFVVKSDQVTQDNQ